jgi:hypothetical protein
MTDVKPGRKCTTLSTEFLFCTLLIFFQPSPISRHPRIRIYKIFARKIITVGNVELIAEEIHQQKFLSLEYCGI